MVVATTRPETMLGDTAVAVPPGPRGRARRADRREPRSASPRRSAQGARRRSRPSSSASRSARETHLPLAACSSRDMAARRPQGAAAAARPADPADPATSGPSRSSARAASRSRRPTTPTTTTSGRATRTRSASSTSSTPDGTLNDNAGPYAGLDRFAARERVVADLEAQGLLEARRGPRGRDRPLRPLQDADRALPLQAVVRAHGRRRGRHRLRPRHRQGVHAPPGWPRRRSTPSSGDWTLADRPQAHLPPRPGRYRQHLPQLARREARLVHQPPALVGPPHPGLVAARSTARGARRRSQRASSADADGRRASWIARRRRASAARRRRRRRAAAQAPRAAASRSQVCLRDEPPRSGTRRRCEAAGLDAGSRRARHLVLARRSGRTSPSAGPTRRRPRIDDGPDARSAPSGRPRRTALDYYYPGSCLVTAPRHHHAVGGAHGDAWGSTTSATCPFTDVLHPRQHPRRQGRADEQVQGQRHRPGGHHRALRRRRHALRALRHADRHAGHPPAGAGDLALHRRRSSTWPTAKHGRTHLHLPLPRAAARSSTCSAPCADAARGQADQRPLRGRAATSATSSGTRRASR